MRDTKLGDNVLPDKLFGVHISDICQRFDFDPFGKIVSVDEQISFVPYCPGKWPDDIQAQLSERPRAGQWIEGPSWLMYVWCKPLTLVTFLHVFMRFFLHVQPPVALGDGPMG